MMAMVLLPKRNYLTSRTSSFFLSKIWVPCFSMPIPMAISIAFGIIFATFIILLLVPALYLAIEDGIGLGSWLGREKRSDASTPPIDAVETLGADR